MPIATAEPGASTPEKIRVAFVIESLTARTGGTEGQLLTLLDGLDRARFDPVLFCLESSDWLASASLSVPVHVVDVHVSVRPVLAWQLWRFARLLRRGRFHVVQTHFRDGNLAGVLAAWMAGTGVIVSTRRGEPYWTSPFELGVLKWLNGKVDWFIANSEATRTRYARDEGIDIDRITVVYNGVDTDRFRLARATDRVALRERLGLPGSAPVVGIIANLRSVKGLPDFLRAAAIVLRTFSDVHFVLVGEGEQELELRALGAELEIADRVHFLGAREDVPELLPSFDIGVLSSHFESFSNSILEYVAAGLPVVVTDVGGAREVIREGREGFVVPPRDHVNMARALSRLLEHPGGPRAWRDSDGLDDRFSRASMVHAHEDLYLRLVRGANARSG